ncbi:MAG: OmpA family protein [Bacteroidota bacterium]
MKKMIFSTFCFLTSAILYSQNLISNYSFENGNCPYDYSGMSNVDEWGEYSHFSSDYFNSCVKEIQSKYIEADMSVPDNIFGHQDAKTGNAYAGFAYANEIIQTKLISPLQKDSLYFVSFFVNLSESSSFAIWRIGAFISNSPIKYDGTYLNVYKSNPQILNDSLNYITDTVEWKEIFGYYKAKGGESFISIGSFASVDNDRKILNDNTKQKRYYYIDDVSISKINEKDRKDIARDTIIAIDGLLFEIGKDTLLLSKNEVLDALIKSLKFSKNYLVDISGHTDNVGDEKNNIKLSTLRAKYIASYFIKSGINQRLVSYQGFGSSKPISNNKSSGGRAKNRRVDINITFVK